MGLGGEQQEPRQQESTMLYRAVGPGALELRRVGTWAQGGGDITSHLPR